ncbi:ICAM5 protein, partial [Neopipo cinnamomea]|nr:ICAM5 protein [Neopipo cinnamomea]
TRDTPRSGPTRAWGTHVVSRADAGRYVCRATNRHGVATRDVVVTVEYEPSIPELGCPEQRLWLEGTLAQLGCAATGNPLPRVTCAKVGDSWDHPLVTPNATRTELGDTWDHPLVTANLLPTVRRTHAGTYQCRATNTHGSAVRNVTVAVEYGPTTVTLRALPSADVTRGSTFSLDCSAEGVPAPTFTWALPPAPNLRLGPDNHSVTVTGATAANRGLYTCTASNRHGRSAGSVLVSVDESWLVALVALGSLGAVALVALVVAGGLYLKSTACKKGEYNVRDAEGSSEATCLHRTRPCHDPSDIFGIQLSPP